MREVRESMGYRKGHNVGCVEPRAITGGRKVAVRNIEAQPRGSDVILEGDLEDMALNRRGARNAERTGERRGIGILGSQWTLVLGIFMASFSG
jgi:hypothetical protein